MLMPNAFPSDSQIVIDCPVCRRVIWNGTRCHHGEVVVLTPDVPKGEPEGEDVVTKANRVDKRKEGKR